MEIKLNFEMDDNYYFKKEFIHILFRLCEKYGLYYEFYESDMIFACQYNVDCSTKKTIKDYSDSFIGFSKELLDTCTKVGIPKTNVRNRGNIFAVKLSKTEQ